MAQPRDPLHRLLREIRGCRICEPFLPLGPRPVLRARSSARLLIVGQAPGTRVHASGIPWDDRSGDRLRQWLGVDRQTFYDDRRIAIVPMGFCYPGVDPRGGDNPPRPECAPLWHDRVLEHLPALELVLLIGSYAQKRYLGARRARTMGQTVAAWRDHLPRHLPLPHPSWRNTAWLKRNAWFETELVPVLQGRVAELVGGEIAAQIRVHASAARP
jgi:uracil-DNA glycosylase